MKTNKMKRFAGAAIAVVMLFTMSMGVLAAESPSADFQSGTKAAGPNGEVVNVVMGAATVAPAAADITAAVANGTLASSFDLSAPDWDFTKGALTITFPLAGATADTKAAVLHYNGSAWENVTGTVADGTITGVFTSLSPVAIVVDKASLNGSTGGTTGTSPKTGESSMVLILGMFAVVAVAGAYGLNKKRA